MCFDLFIPYIEGASIDINDNLNDYYKTGKEYADALINEDTSYGSQVYNIMSRGELENVIGYESVSKNHRHINEKIVYSKAECKLLTPNGANFETVDSMIDKFASQQEFLIMAHFDMSSMDSEFEEELKCWSHETLNILRYSREMLKNGISRNDTDIFIEKNIPRKNLRLSFLNKSNKRVNFILKSCEIEQKIAKNRYLLYVKRMEILK